MPGGFIIGIAGARDPTPWGVGATRNIVGMLVSDGYIIASGVGRGIDWIAVITALKLGGRVVGVPPYYNYRTEYLINHGGVVITPEIEPRENVNRLLAYRDFIFVCISDAVIIPEARYRIRGWGTRITVDFARRFKKPVFILKPRNNAPEDVKRGFEELTRKYGAIPIQDYNLLKEIIKKIVPTK